MTAPIALLGRAVGDSVNAVDARELWRALEVGRDFSNWIKSRIAELGLVEGVDFEKLNGSASPNLASANRVDYVVGLDAAKHIALAERTEVGRRVRAYFIEAEKRARDPLAVLANLSTPDLHRLLLTQNERLLAAESAVEAVRPKVEAFDRVMSAGDTIGFREATKILRDSTGVTERELAATLRRLGWAQRLDGRLAPASYGEGRGYVTSRLSEWSGADGATHARPEFRITPKGLARLAEILRPEVM